jgi:crossover junction endodeoxyribonuclease RuvC
MIILGIDPGTAQLGWGVIQLTANSKQQTAGRKSRSKGKNQNVIKHIDHGLIKTSSSRPKGERLSSLKREVAKLVKEYEVGEIVAEKIFFNINKKSAISVSQALGVIHMAADDFKIPVYEYNALEAKRLVAGYGRADKKDIQKEMKKRLRLKKTPTPVHAADALAIALCHLIRNGKCSPKNGV